MEMSTLFHTPSGWKLITEQLPEKPIGLYPNSPWDDVNIKHWREQIETLKASALDIANFDEFISHVIDGFPYLKGMSAPIRQIEGQFYKWPGSFNIIGMDETGNSNCSDSEVSKEVAFLILPSEQRMANALDIETLSRNEKKNMISVKNEQLTKIFQDKCLLNNELKQVIRELLPIIEQYRSHVNKLEGKDEFDKSEDKIIQKAKLLL